MQPNNRPLILLQLLLNGLFSWLILPLIILPSHTYGISQLLDVLFWQGIAFVGWPFAMLGMPLSMLFGQGSTGLVNFLLILMYPAMALLLLRVFLAKSSKLWEWILLHLILLISFAIMWIYINAGYDFMVG